MVKPLPSWFSRAEAMHVNDIIAVETLNLTQHQILVHLRKLDGKFRTRRIRKPSPEVGFWVERLE
jgi:hypothetical protein